jgi:hypothetical protein
MNTEVVKQIINENHMLLNIGGHYFEGTTKHDRKSQGLLQMSDLTPFEKSGMIKRVNGYDGIGKQFVRAFVPNTELINKKQNI